MQSTIRHTEWCKLTLLKCCVWYWLIIYTVFSCNLPSLVKNCRPAADQLKG
jgi:hypothetical protein